MKKRILGIDENGLGPLMGPLIVTGTLLKQSGDRTAWFEDIADSKFFFRTRSKNNFSRIEETAISVFYLWKRQLPLSPAEILNTFCGRIERSPETSICTGKIPEKFIWAEPESVKKRCGAFSEWAIKNSIEIETVKSIPVYVYRINEFVKKEGSKILLDFLTFCDIMKNVPDKNGMDVQAGKIGGLKFYKTYLRYAFPDYEPIILQEKEENSSYLLKNHLSEFCINFIMDVEKKSFPAALSSITGKYVREIFMESIRKTLGIKENISGYHDKKTLQCIASLSLNDEEFPPACLFRSK
jgi:ribonuclease HII